MAVISWRMRKEVMCERGAWRRGAVYFCKRVGRRVVRFCRREEEEVLGGREEEERQRCWGEESRRRMSLLGRRNPQRWHWEIIADPMRALHCNALACKSWTS